MRASSLCLLGLLAATPAWSAINPAEYQRIADNHLHLHETARIVDETIVEGHHWRRVTLVGTLVGELGEQHGDRHGQVFVIDYTVDLDARQAAMEAWQKENGTMPGPQFLAEPDPPQLDGEGNFWAHVAESGGRLGNVNRHAGRVVFPDHYAATGAVYVPVGAQYSFDPPNF
jgi:hypothetical protein